MRLTRISEDSLSDLCPACVSYNPQTRFLSTCPSPLGDSQRRCCLCQKRVMAECPPRPLWGSPREARTPVRGSLHPPGGSYYPGNPHVTSPHQFTFQHQIHLSHFTAFSYTSTTPGFDKKSCLKQTPFLSVFTSADRNGGRMDKFPSKESSKIDPLGMMTCDHVRSPSCRHLRSTWITKTLCMI